MKDSSTNTLFQLLRLALGNKEDCSLSADVNWRNLIDLSFDQGVAAIAVDGLGFAHDNDGSTSLTTSSDNDNQEGLELALDSPELEDLKYEWFGSVFQAEEDYKKYVEDIASLSKTYSEAGIEMMVLKGYGLSLNYPVPAHRPVGDVDVYLSDWRRGDEVIRRRGIAIDYSHHHHSVFSWKGQMVENHYDIVNRYAGKSGRMEDDMFKQMATEGRKEVVVDGTKVYLPSATFNGIFLLRHASAHFAGSHITLRHLLDWALFVDRQWKEIDWPFVTDWLTRLGLRRFFCCMNALSIDCLGIAAEKFPVLERDAALEQRVLADILHPTFDEKGSGFLFKLRRLRANMWKRNLVALEPLLPRMVRLAWSHVVRPEEG